MLTLVAAYSSLQDTEKRKFSSAAFSLLHGRKRERKPSLFIHRGQIVFWQSQDLQGTFAKLVKLYDRLLKRELLVSSSMFQVSLLCF